jgi:SAM-dependent methyltransferase
MKCDMERQLRRQSLWLKESWLWVLITKVLPHYRGRSEAPPNLLDLFSEDGPGDAPPGAKGGAGGPKEDPRPSALDVGCGPGYVMDIFRPALAVKGVDIDGDMVALCKARGLDVKKAPAEKLPFKDGSFDIVYCTFLLLWVNDPAKVLREMARVSRKWVLCLAEPDYGARIDHPAEMADVGKLVGDVMRDEGADPHIGRKLRSLYRHAGLEAELGLHAGVWDLRRSGPGSRRPAGRARCRRKSSMN